MPINQLNMRNSIQQNPKQLKVHQVFMKLLSELRSREIPEEIIDLINASIDQLNAIECSDSKYVLQIRSEQNKILQLIEKELKLVTKSHYQNLWTALGMCVFGLPIGVLFSQSLDNMAFIGMGLPIGLVIGIALGQEKDKKAKENGLQLDLEVGEI